MADRELKVIISGDPSSLKKAFGDTSKGASKLGKGLKNLGKVAAVGVGAAFAGLAITLREGFQEVAEGQQVLAQTNAVLKSTGGVANVTAKEVTNLASSLSNLTAIDDENIQASENLLLTFTNIRNELGKGNDIFNQATLAVADMATAMSNGAVPSMEKLNSTTILVGKALNDPVKGMTALRRVGVAFTAEQENQIKALVKSGHAMDAQKLILRELTKEFGGSAKAAGETLPGQLEKLRNTFSEVAGEIFTTLLPYLTQFLDWVNRNMPTIQQVIQTTLDAVIATINFLVPIIERLIAEFQRLADAANKHWPEVQRAAERVMAWYEGTLKPAVENVLTAIRAFWERFGADIAAIAKKWLNVVVGIYTVIFGNLASIVQAFLALIGGDWQQAWDEIKEIPKRTLGAVVQIVRNVVGIILTTAKAVGAALIDGMLAGIKAGWGQLVNFVTSIPGRIRSAIGDLGAVLFNAGFQVIAGFLDGIKQKFQDVLDFVTGIPGKIAGVVKSGFKIFSPSQVMIDIGTQVMEGLGVGIDISTVKVEDEAADAINRVIDKAVAAVEQRKGALGEAFSELTSNALAAFDKLEEDFETRTERKIRLEDERRARQERQQRLSEAQTGLAAAQAGGDPEEIRRAQQELADAQFEIQRAADEKRAAQERAAHENRQALRRRHFEEELALLQKNLETGRISQEKAQEKILGLFKKYHIPYKNAGGALGLALAEGIKDSFADVSRAVKNLVETIAEQLQKIRIVVHVQVQRGDEAAGRRAEGGPVRRGDPYLVGERGPELFVPGQSGTVLPHGMTASALAGGGVTNVFQFPNYVGDQRDLERTMQTIMRRFENSNGVSFTGRSL